MVESRSVIRNAKNARGLELSESLAQAILSHTKFRTLHPFLTAVNVLSFKYDKITKPVNPFILFKDLPDRFPFPFIYFN